MEIFIHLTFFFYFLLLWFKIHSSFWMLKVWSVIGSMYWVFMWRILLCTYYKHHAVCLLKLCRIYLCPQTLVAGKSTWQRRLTLELQWDCSRHKRWYFIKILQLPMQQAPSQVTCMHMHIALFTWHSCSVVCDSYLSHRSPPALYIRINTGMRRMKHIYCKFGNFSENFIFANSFKRHGHIVFATLEIRDLGIIYLHQQTTE